MVKTTTLLSLLQFVALAAPAIAILLQVVQNQRGGQFVFHLLTTSLIMIISGGLLITYQISQLIVEPVVLIGVGLIFFSLLILAAALGFTTILTAWESRPEAEMSGLNTYARSVLKKVGTGLFAFVFIGSTYSILLLGVQNYLNRFLAFGVFFEGGVASPIVFFIIISALLAIQSLIRLIENGILPNEDIQKVARSTFIILFTWIVGYTLFVSPAFLLAIFAIEFGISSTHILLNASYLWAGFVAVILFAVDVEID